jgi:NTE family protein
MLGLVLPGGGARGAFQVGVLKAIAEILPRRCCNPFPIISGTSAGAINATVLASNARRFRRGVAELDYVWSNFHSADVYRSDGWTMFRSSMHWMAALVTGGNFIGAPRSLLDNAPLRELLRRSIRFPRIQQNIDSGFLDALAITAASYGSARSATFFQGREDLKPWSRTRRIGVREQISLDHLMASAAVPIIFPPVSINGEFFGDGAMRQATPLSPAVHLGADRILVISLRDESGDAERQIREPAGEPSLAQIAGYMLDTLFMDGLYADLERITRVNLLVDAVPEEHRVGPLEKLRPIDTMVVVPSKDLRDIAVAYKEELSFHVRMLLRGVAGRRAGEQRLLSFLLFEQKYTRELIQLGYRDAMAIRDDLLGFVTGAPASRLFAPDWVRNDLLSLDGG